ncbi:uncharacterized protein EURHEDRAFT_411547 [Aspergillus ruber CBS 135680]|uniref:Uncharacterized protein n=1 Tax=Aspergillus ruber (strain CBS 135680) TaxID=1388766 RepID=A0A017SGN8_ASPRC|nr:uncharacterized protein EURHEDRAFT_411547 [Aspergillus ruber CBS 135680]EYE95824.1 hypothetical protein EURHEDRAFT_411547 [Aspergillus ruber CBS 135680]
MGNVSRQLGQLYEQSQVLINHANQRENMVIPDWISSAPPNEDHTRTLDDGKLNRDYANSGKWLFFGKNSSRGAIPTMAVYRYCGCMDSTGKSSLVCLIIEHFLKQSLSLYKEAYRVAY